MRPGIRRAALRIALVVGGAVAGFGLASLLAGPARADQPADPLGRLPTPGVEVELDPGADLGVTVDTGLGVDVEIGSGDGVSAGIDPGLDPLPGPVTPLVDTLVDPVLDTVVDTVLDPVLDTVVDTVLDPVVEPVVQPVVEPVVGPLPEPDTEPANRSGPALAGEPSTVTSAVVPAAGLSPDPGHPAFVPTFLPRPAGLPVPAAMAMPAPAGAEAGRPGGPRVPLPPGSGGPDGAAGAVDSGQPLAGSSGPGPEQPALRPGRLSPLDRLVRAGRVQAVDPLPG